MSHLIGKKIVSVQTEKSDLLLYFEGNHLMRLGSTTQCCEVAYLICPEPESMVGKILKTFLMRFLLRDEDRLHEELKHLPKPSAQRVDGGDLDWDREIQLVQSWYLQFEGGTEHPVVLCMEGSDGYYLSTLTVEYKENVSPKEEPSFVIHPDFLKKIVWMMFDYFFSSFIDEKNRNDLSFLGDAYTKWINGSKRISGAG